MNSIGGPELILILAALAVIVLGMAVLAGAIFLIVRAAGKSRPIPMAPPLPPVDSQAPAHPTPDSSEVQC